MSRTSSFFQQVPSSSLFSGRSKLCKGLYLVPVRVLYPMSCFCKQMQTTTYEIVKGNYVVSNPHDQQGKKMAPSVFDLYCNTDGPKHKHRRRILHLLELTLFTVVS
nr:uncharacterized protein LOC117281085 isoform X2 [Nicotiana tomentosiformis]